MVEHLGSSQRGMNRTDAREGPNQEVRKQKSLDVLKTQFKQDRDKERENIQHTRVEISKTARFRDRTKQKLGLEVSKRTPERVNEQVGRFKNALRKIGNKSNYLDYLPRDLRPLFMEVVESLPVRFQAALENAVDSYDS